MSARSLPPAMFLVALAVSIAGCGGGGGDGPGPVPFEVASSMPEDGSADFQVHETIVITFTRKTDLGTVTPDSLRLERSDGTVVPTRILAEPFNSANVRLDPVNDLAVNEVYRIRIASSLQSEDGAALGEDHFVCFLIAGPGHVIRPDQVLDLGDRLQVARHLARGVRATDGRFFLFGGHESSAAATDTIEVYEPDTRTFRLLDARMQTPRAEHTATLLSSGKILLAGGVASEGGPPLASTDVFDPANESCVPGPTMNDARRWHGAATREGGQSVMVAGGYDAAGEMMDSIEFLDGDDFVRFAEPLAEPSAQLTMIRFAHDQVYCTASNFLQVASIFDGGEIDRAPSVDIRFRAAWRQVDPSRWMLFGGDTRSVMFLEGNGPTRHLASVLTAHRRGAHSLTLRSTGDDSDFYLAAGGFNIGNQGAPPVRTVELVEYRRFEGPGGRGDAVIHRLDDFLLPIPMAGHVGFNELTGSTVLAGGVGDGSGPHSRRVIVILDEKNTPPVKCGG